MDDPFGGKYIEREWLLKYQIYEHIYLYEECDMSQGYLIDFESTCFDFQLHYDYLFGACMT